MAKNVRINFWNAFMVYVFLCVWWDLHTYLLSNTMMSEMMYTYFVCARERLCHCVLRVWLCVLFKNERFKFLWNSKHGLMNLYKCAHRTIYPKIWAYTRQTPTTTANVIQNTRVHTYICIYLYFVKPFGNPIMLNSIMLLSRAFQRSHPIIFSKQNLFPCSFGAHFGLSQLWMPTLCFTLGNLITDFHEVP